MAVAVAVRGGCWRDSFVLDRKGGCRVGCRRRDFRGMGRDMGGDMGGVMIVGRGGGFKGFFLGGGVVGLGGGEGVWW